MAVGAQSLELVRLSIGRTMLAGCIGIVVGLLAALWTSRALSRFLFGVESWDPVTYAVVAAVLLGLSLLAGALPARRATRIDPVQVLREEAR